MKAILLDSNIITRYPKILSIKVPDADIFVTPNVLDEIDSLYAKNENSKVLLNLIQTAIDEGLIVKHPTKITRIESYKTKSFASDSTNIYWAGLGGESLIILAQQISHAYEKIMIA